MSIFQIPANRDSHDHGQPEQVADGEAETHRDVIVNSRTGIRFHPGTYARHPSCCRARIRLFPCRAQPSNEGATTSRWNFDGRPTNQKLSLKQLSAKAYRESKNGNT